MGYSGRAVYHCLSFVVWATDLLALAEPMPFPNFADGLARPAAVVVAIAFSIITGFLLFWALGGMWGLAAHWGGTYRQLPLGLRALDAVSAVLFGIGALIVLGRAGYWASTIPFAVLRLGTWAFVAILALSAVMNFASSSNWERILIAPVVLFLALLCLIVARSPAP
jgi:hypothetical protein